LKFKEISSVNDFLDNVMANGYFPKITMPTRLTHRYGTLIDNFFVKISHSYSPTTARVLLSNISDHLPYFISLDYINVSKCPEKFVKLCPSGLENFENLRTDLTSNEAINKLQNILTDDPNDSCDNFNNILAYYIDKHFPLRFVRYNKYKHRRSKWISNAILKSISFRDKLYVNLKSLSPHCTQYQHTLINFKTYNRILKQTIRSAKRLHFHKCFQNCKSDIKKTWQTINGIINQQKNSNDYPKEFLIGNSFSSDYNKIANEFNKYFTEIGPKLASQIKPPENKSYKDFLKSPTQNTFSFSAINIDMVTKAIDSLKPKTSYGHDRISNKLLKYVKYEISWPLMQLINQSFHSGIFPRSLKIAKVTPLHKKNEKYIFDNYRPVSILPSVSKVFERIMHQQIYHYFDNFKLFFISQYGFRPNHSTELAVLELTDRILMEMDKNNVPVNIFMDLSKAFDTLDHQILLHKLKYYGFRDVSYNLMQSYLSNRLQYIEINNTQSDYLELKCGVPQGSILGPLLFIIYINDLHTITENLTPIIYADDTSMLASLNTNNFSAVQDEINDELKSVSDWLKLNKLSLNIAKTKAMMFRTSQRQIATPAIFIDSVKIDFVREFNFLGIVLDESLKMKAHVNYISKKVGKTIGILTKLKHILPLEALLNIYNALILSYLNYGTLTWGWQNNKLTKLQKKALRIMTNSKYNAHTTVLFKQLNLLKLEDICALHDYKFCYKFINGLIPEYFINTLSPDFSHNYYTRHATDLRLPAVRHEFARRGIRFRFPHIYNNIPENIKCKIFTHSMFGFKFYIKRKIIENYNTTCPNRNCFVCNN